VKTKDVVVVPYDLAWPAAFDAIREELAMVLEDACLAIEHVGSTAVPGLCAKPIVDIDVVIDTAARFPFVRARLEAAGYRHEGDLGIAGREAFKYDDKPHLMCHHLYVCVSGNAELRRHLAFRDHLRNDSADRDSYGAVKRAAAARHPHDIDAYIAEKGEIIARILAECGNL